VLYGNTCMKGRMAFRMPMQPDSGRAISSRSPPIRLQKQGVGEPRRPLSIVLYSPPCQGPVPGRRSRGRTAQLQRGGGGGKKKAHCSPRLGGTRQYRPGLCAPTHETLPCRTHHGGSHRRLRCAPRSSV
jgi:hypothetical protein